MLLDDPVHFQTKVRQILDGISEPEFVNVSVAQESIPKDRFLKPILLGGPVRQPCLSPGIDSLVSITELFKRLETLAVLAVFSVMTVPGTL